MMGRLGGSRMPWIVRNFLSSFEGLSPRGRIIYACCCCFTACALGAGDGRRTGWMTVRELENRKMTEQQRQRQHDTATLPQSNEVIREEKPWLSVKVVGVFDP